MNTTDTATHTQLLHDLQTLVTEAEKMISNSGADCSKDDTCSLRSRLASAQEKVSGFYDGAKQKVTAGMKCTDEAVRARPYQSMAIAAGAGLLLGVILGRRSH